MQRHDANAVVGRAVGRLRKTRGWSQADLAQRLAETLGRTWDPSAVARMESGKRTTSVNELTALAAIFDTPIAEIVSDEEPIHQLARTVREARGAAIEYRAAVERYSGLMGRARAILRNHPELESQIGAETADFINSPVPTEVRADDHKA